MYKWQSQTAIGYKRPLAVDFARAAEGIAASLKQFHVSVSRADAEADAGEEKPRLRISRTQRAVAAAAAISSLRPAPPRAIDARALAAAPPSGFTIRRVDFGDGRGGGLNGLRGGMTGTRGRGRGRGRGDFSARGGIGVRGRGRGRGMRARGRGGRGRGVKKRKFLSRADEEDDGNNKLPLTEEEREYLDGVKMGVRRPYQADLTTQERLELEIPPVATDSAPMGLVASVRAGMQVLTCRSFNGFIPSEEHTKEYIKGYGTLFMNDQDKADAEGELRHIWSVKKYELLDDAQREVILSNIVAGKYQPMEAPRKEDTMGLLQTYGQKNKTYLQSDTDALKARVKTLMPVQKAAASAKQATPR